MLILKIPENVSSAFCPAGILSGGSVNQTDPSDFTTTSLGLFNFFSPYAEASEVSTPLLSLRATLRNPVCVRINLPCKSSVNPFELSDGLIYASAPPVAVHEYTVFEGMSEKRRPALSFHTGPSTN